MIGIEQIEIFLPKGRVSNYERREKFDIDDYFIEEKIGFREVSVKNEVQETSDMACEAISKLNTDFSKTQCLVVVTQNPDHNIPHTSAIIHGKLNLPKDCACFDISLGCSGFVHGLSVISGFMESNQMTHGILVTADPYSKIIDTNDKSTALLFGDGASATLISNNPVYKVGKFTFGTLGKDHQELMTKDHILFMNGRSIFNFAAKEIPKDIANLLALNKLEPDDIDLFLFHQGSKYIVDTLARRLKIDAKKAPFLAKDYGNLVSSSIPVLIAELGMPRSTMVLSGFGVGLSWSSTIIKG